MAKPIGDMLVKTLKEHNLMNSINTVADNINLNECILSICKHITSILKDCILQDTNQYCKDYYANYNKLQSILECYEEFNREDIALYRTNDFIEYIFKNKKLTEELVDFINDVWELFADLIELKLNSLNSNNDFSKKDYKIKYEQYRDKIHDYEHYFHVNIYQPTCDYVYLAAQIGNILIDDFF